MIRAKKCRGRDKTKGRGCREVFSVEKLRYGLCPSCLYDWSINTDEGKQWFKKQYLKKTAEAKKRKKKLTKEQRISNMSLTKYRSELVQPIVNEIARLIDFRQPCICTGATTGKMNGGHRWSVGSRPDLALNLHNIHKQSYKSNVFDGGDETKYDEGLRLNYSNEYKNFVHFLRSYESVKPTKEELKEFRVKAMQIRLELKNNLKVYTQKERIEKRNEINGRLGLYPTDYSVFKIKT